MTFLIAIGGSVGTGKTTLAYGLRKKAEKLEKFAIVEEDQIRRDMLGYDLKYVMTDKDYAPEISTQVTEKMVTRMAEFLEQGISVINPSGFFTENARAAVQKLAEDNNAEFIGLWLTAPEETMKSRIRQRMKEREKLSELSLDKGHASDADESVIVKFGPLEPPQSHAWKFLDAGQQEEALVKAALLAL